MSQDDRATQAKSQRAELRAERARMQRVRLSEAGVALAALLISLSVMGVNFYNERRGSEMVVLQPEVVALYRERPPPTSGKAEDPREGVLWIALQVQMVNAAREHGDVVVGASASLGEREGRDVWFPYNALIEPIMSADVDRAVENCPEGARCLPATGFYVVERQKKLLDVPGGSSRTEFLAFQIEDVNCLPADDLLCARFDTYGSVIDLLRETASPKLTVNVDYHFDGEKTLECQMTSDPIRLKAIFDYIDRNGWAMVSCISEI